MKIPQHKTALLVVDMQHDFTKPGGKAYYEMTEQMLKTYPEKINKMREKGVLNVPIYTIHDHDKPVNPELTRMA